MSQSATLPAELPAPGGSPKPLHRILLGLAIVLLVGIIGLPNLDAQWVQGDEYSFIARNVDVTGVGSREPTVVRWILIFFDRHLDLYQPIPILTYAIEAEIWGEQRTFAMRITDVLIHAVNALLVWRVLRTLLQRFAPGAADRLEYVTWSLALLWAVHPVLTGAFAADMGRTHLLSTMFLLLSLAAQLRAVGALRGTSGFWAVAFLILAMLCKPVAGWFLIAFAVDAALLGWSTALRLPRTYLNFVICAVFAALTLWATQAENMLKDSEPALFGDPITRSLVAISYYAQHLIWPVNLTTWYPPDPRTGWAYWATWVGLVIFGGSVFVAAKTWRRNPMVSVGLVWFWAAILPLLGIVGARVAAAQDRYLYVPLIGGMIALAAGLTRWIGDDRRRAASSAGLIVVAGLVCTPLASQLNRDARSTVRRAERVAARDPLDPRRSLLRAVAYEFAARNGDPEIGPELQPILSREYLAALTQAVLSAENPPPNVSYFKDGRDRAMFHYRVGEQLFALGDFEGCYDQARRAVEFDPTAPLALMQLAHACQALGLYAEELEVYRTLESHLPANADFRAKRLTEFGTLLLEVFEQPVAAKLRFQKALEADPGQIEARLGLARCEILAGQGAIGLAEVNKVMAAVPGHPGAQLTLALYHARSQQWEDAYKVYQNILMQEPTHYDALRGFHGVCVELDRMRDATQAWQDAMRKRPEDAVYRAFFVFSAACAGLPEAGQWADEWIAEQADNRFAYLAKMVIAAREKAYPNAVAFVEKAANSTPVPRARDMARAEAFLRRMQQTAELGPEGNLMRAAILARTGQTAQSEELIAAFLATEPSADLKALAASIRQSATSAPASEGSR